MIFVPEPLLEDDQGSRRFGGSIFLWIGDRSGWHRRPTG